MLVLVPGLLREPPAADARRRRHRRVAVAGRHRRARCGCGGSAAPSSCSRSPRSSASRCSACCRASPSPSRCRSSTCSGARGGRTRRRSAGSRAWPGYHDRALLPRGRASCPGWSSSASTRRCSSPTPGRSATQIRAPGRAPSRAPRWIVVAAEPITDVDTTAADMLARPRRGAQRARAPRSCSPSSRTRSARKIERYELIGPLDPDHFFPTLEAAIDAFRRADQCRVDTTRPGHATDVSSTDHPFGVRHSLATSDRTDRP